MSIIRIAWIVIIGIAIFLDAAGVNEYIVCAILGVLVTLSLAYVEEYLFSARDLYWLFALMLVSFMVAYITAKAYSVNIMELKDHMEIVRPFRRSLGFAFVCASGLLVSIICYPLQRK